MAVVAAMAVPHPPIILPEIGRGEENKIARTTAAYREVMRRAAALEPDTVVITSPHATMYGDYFHISPGKKAVGDFSAFRCPEVKIEAAYDDVFSKALADACAADDLPAGFLGEREPALDHGTMIPLYFLQPELRKPVKVVRIGLSGLGADVHYRLGEKIAETAEKLGRRVVFIASGDLSHKLKEDGPYGFAKEGPVFDEEVTKALGAADFLSLLTISPELAEGAAECGLRSFWIMAGAFDCQMVHAELLAHEGPFGVGYGVAYFTPEGRDDSRDIGRQLIEKEANDIAAIREHEDAYVRLARESLETFVRSHVMMPMPKDLPEDLQDRRAGCFVSIKKDGACAAASARWHRATAISPRRSSATPSRLACTIRASRRSRRTNFRDWSTTSMCCLSRSQSTRRRLSTSSATASSCRTVSGAASCCRISPVWIRWTSRLPSRAARAISARRRR